MSAFNDLLDAARERASTKKRAAFNEVSPGAVPFPATTREPKPRTALAEALERKRLDLGLTRRAFSALIGIETAQRYSDFIAGRRLPTLRQARMAYKIGIPAEILLRDEPASAGEDDDDEDRR